MPLDVIFRSCTRVNAEHAGKRPCGATKSQVTLCCLYSLIKSCANQDVTVYILDDHSLEEDVTQMRSLLKQAGDRHQFVSLSVTGNGESMKATYEYAREKNLSLIYFCEDDYLHLPEAIAQMLHFYHDFDGDCLIHPTDYTDRYLRDKPQPSWIYLGRDRHWRSIQYTTGTFMLSQNMLRKYWTYYMRFARWNMKGEAGGEDKTINKVYRKETCVSPMPSLAAHFSPEPEMPRFVDWEKVFKQYKEELNL